MAGAATARAERFAVKVTGLTKAFSGIPAVDDLSLTIRRGEIHGIVGHNGSGKSTLMRVLSGFYEADAGEIIWGDDGTTALAAIHQDLCLRNDMTVVENFGISSSYGNRFGIEPVSWSKQRVIAHKALEGLGLNIDTRALVGSLSPAERASLAIARSITEIRRSGHPGLLIVDESTAYFSSREIDLIRAVLRRLVDDGHAVIIITHNIREALATADRVSVLRNGQLKATLKSSETTEAEVISLMLGRTLESYYPDPDLAVEHTSGQGLEIAGLTDAHVDGFDLSAAAGEVVGVTGLLGSGFDRVPYLVVGASAAVSGFVSLEGRPLKLTPAAAQAAGVSIVPANRAVDGVWMQETATDNYTFPRLRDFWRLWRLDRRRERHATEEAITRFGVLPPRTDLLMSGFSGGNQQKLLMASRWAPGRTKVLLLHEPTQGVDTGAKVDILKEIHKAAAAGVVVVVFSSDHEELVNLCSRVVIMSTAGTISQELRTEGISEDDLAAACMAAG